jgi:glutamate carboxypeptidase
MDTVFPEDTDFTWFKENEKHVYGPGVIDMKGGLVAGIYALKALSSIRMLKKNTPDIRLQFR